MFRRFFDALMRGRSGADHLGAALLITSAVLFIVGRIFSLQWLTAAAWFPMLLVVYRFFSRDIVRRRTENDRFLSLLWPIKSRFGRRAIRCPSCSTVIRVSKRQRVRGITCPDCGFPIPAENPLEKRHR